MINANTANTLFVGVDIPTDTTFQLTAHTIAQGLFSHEILNVGANPVLFTNTSAQFSGSDPSFLQINNQNFNANGSADYIATADIGGNANNFIDLGINNSLFNGGVAFSSMKALDGYLYVHGTTDTSSDGNLIIGTASTGANVIFVAGNTTAQNIIMTLTKSGLVLNTQSSLTVSANIIANTITTTSGNLILDPQGLYDVVLPSGTELYIQSGNNATSNTNGALIVTGGVGISGNVYSGGINITGSGNGVTFVDGTTQTTAGSSVANTVYLQGALNSANANIGLLQAYANQANANIALLFGIENSQNANIISLQSNVSSINTYAYSAYNKANTPWSYLSNGSYTLLVQSDGQLVLPQTTLGGAATGSFTSTSNVSINAAGNLWKFDNLGNLNGPYGVNLTTAGIRYNDGTYQNTAASPVSYSQASFALANTALQNTTTVIVNGMNAATINTSSVYTPNTILNNGLITSANVQANYVVANNIGNSVQVGILVGSSYWNFTANNGLYATGNVWVNNSYNTGNVTANTVVYGSSAAASPVTQGTSRSTSVTANGTSGQIICYPTGAWQHQTGYVFTVNNSSILHTSDVVFVSIQSTTCPVPQVSVANTRVGSFDICIYNAGGAGQDGPYTMNLNFGVIRVGS
jgi:hypothetical protein